MTNEHNAKKFCYDVKEVTPIDMYKTICCLFKDILEWGRCSGYSHNHTHHIKPKSIYPLLTDKWFNKVEVPDIVHWALHQLLSRYAKESGDQKFKNIAYSDVASFINEKHNAEYNFCDNMLDEIVELCFSAAVVCRKIGLFHVDGKLEDIDKLDIDVNEHTEGIDWAFGKTSKNGEVQIMPFRVYCMMSLFHTYKLPVLAGDSRHVNMNSNDDMQLMPKYRTFRHLSNIDLPKETKSSLLKLQLIDRPYTPEGALDYMRATISKELSLQLCFILDKYQKPDILDFTESSVKEIIALSK